MTDKRISELTLATSLATTDYFPVVQAGLTKRATFDLLPFSPTGTGAISETVPAALRRLVHTAQYSTVGNFNTARDALTGTIGLSPSVEQTHALDAGDYPWTISTANTDASDFNFAIGDFLNDGVRNTVLRLGYNAAYGGGARDAANGAHFLSWESKYRTGGVNYMEFHWEGINGAGASFRPWTWAVNLSAFFVDHAISVSQYTIYDKTTVYPVLQITSISASAATFKFGTATTVEIQSSLVTDGVLTAAGGINVSGGSGNPASIKISGNASTASQVFGVDVNNTAPATATVVAAGYISNIGTAAAAFTCADVINFYSQDASKGAGSTITELTGFWCSNLSVGASNYGFRGLVSSGSNKYNLFMDGTAQNYLAGVTGVGVVPSTTTALNLAAGTTGVSSMRLAHGSAPTSPVNGDLWTTTAGLFVRVNGVTVGPLT